MYNKKEWKSNFSIIKGASNNIENGIEANDIEIESLLSNRNNNILNTEHFFDFSNVGIDSIADTALINEIFAYSKEYGYNYILFPKEKTFLIEPIPSNNSCDWSIFIPTNTIVDLNKSTFKIREDYDISANYVALAFERNCKNSILMNGVIKGNKNTSPHFETAHSQNSNTIAITGHKNKLINIIIEDTLGDGLIFADQLIKSTRKQTDLFYNYDISRNEINKCILSTDFLIFDEYYARNTDISIDIHYTSGIKGEEGILHHSSFVYKLYFYNENQELIKFYSLNGYEGLHRDMIPIDTYYFRASLIATGEITGFTGNIYFLSQELPIGCEIINCKIDGGGRNGLTVGFAMDCSIKNSVICNTKGKAPQRGIDLEAEWGGTSNFTVDGCTFYNNATGAFAACKFRNLQVLNNRVHETFAITYGGDFVVRNNLFSKGGNFCTNYSVTNTAKGLFEHNQMICADMGENTLVNFDNAIINNNYFYNIVAIRASNHSTFSNNCVYMAKANYKGLTLTAKNIIGNEIYNFTSFSIDGLNIVDNIITARAGINYPSITTDGQLCNINNNVFNIRNTKVYNSVFKLPISKLLSCDILNINNNVFNFSDDIENKNIINLYRVADLTEATNIKININNNISNYNCNPINSSGSDLLNLIINASDNLNINEE